MPPLPGIICFIACVYMYDVCVCMCVGICTTVCPGQLMSDVFFSCYPLYLLIGFLSVSPDLHNWADLAHQLVLGVFCLYLLSTGKQPPGSGNLNSSPHACVALSYLLSSACDLACVFYKQHLRPGRLFSWLALCVFSGCLWQAESPIFREMRVYLIW